MLEKNLLTMILLRKSNEFIRQISTIETVTKGGIENIVILDGGQWL